MICLDTNIVYHFLFETELTSISERSLREAIIEGMAIPMIVYKVQSCFILQPQRLPG